MSLLKILGHSNYAVLNYSKMMQMALIDAFITGLETFITVLFLILLKY